MKCACGKVTTTNRLLLQHRGSCLSCSFPCLFRLASTILGVNAQAGGFNIKHRSSAKQEGLHDVHVPKLALRVGKCSPTLLLVRDAAAHCVKTELHAMGYIMPVEFLPFPHVEQLLFAGLDDHTSPVRLVLLEENEFLLQKHRPVNRLPLLPNGPHPLPSSRSLRTFATDQ